MQVANSLFVTYYLSQVSSNTDMMENMIISGPFKNLHAQSLNKKQVFIKIYQNYKKGHKKGQITSNTQENKIGLLIFSKVTWHNDGELFYFLNFTILDSWKLSWIISQIMGMTFSITEPPIHTPPTDQSTSWYFSVLLVLDFSQHTTSALDLFCSTFEFWIH